MNIHKNKMDTGIDRNIAEEQVAGYVKELLDENAQQLSADTLQRLSLARQLAVNQLALQQTQTINHSGNLLQWFGDYFGHHRAMSAAVIAGAMVITFFAAQQLGFNNNLENSDAFLLASELPPEAYADKGFDTWLDSKVD